jgi:hypothetical protein
MTTNYALTDTAAKFRQLQELELAPSFIQIGDTHRNPQLRNRSYQEAATGYRTAARILPRIAIEHSQLEPIRARLQYIRTLLQSKGMLVEEVVSP